MTAPVAVDVRAVLAALVGSMARMAAGETLSADPATVILAEQMLAAVDELIKAGHRADGDARPAQPERAPGYSDAEWSLFLRGWNAHAEAIHDAGLRTALARVGGPQ